MRLHFMSICTYTLDKQCEYTSISFFTEIQILVIIFNTCCWVLAVYGLNVCPFDGQPQLSGHIDVIHSQIYRGEGRSTASAGRSCQYEAQPGASMLPNRFDPNHRDLELDGVNVLDS